MDTGSHKAPSWHGGRKERDREGHGMLIVSFISYKNRLITILLN
jgi:hypothetical protein